MSDEKCYDTLYEDIKYGTNIITEEEFRKTIVTIADVASEMVEKTLGPYGKTTIIDDGVKTYPTKDGWSVLKRLRFNDPVFNILYEILKQISWELNRTVGDGTTTSFIGASIFLHKIFDFLDKNPGKRQVDILGILKEIAVQVEERLRTSKYLKHIDASKEYDDIFKIAMVSSNGNKELSLIIQDIYKKTNNPNIYATLDDSKTLSYDVQTGYRYDCNPINQKGYRNTDEGTFVLKERSLAVVFDHTVTYNEHDKIITGLSRYASTHRATLFIFAPHFDDIIMTILKTNIESLLQQGQIPNIMLIQVPLSDTIHRKYLSDLILLFNAQLFDYGKVRAFNVMVHNQTASAEDKIEDALLNTDQYKFAEPSEIIDLCVGKINDITVGEKYILIRDYETIVNQNLYKNTIDDLRKEYETLRDKSTKSSSGTLSKDYREAYQHYTKLSGNMGVIKVGGMSDLEKNCLKDSVDDAILACKSAYENGYIRGLNITMIEVLNDLKQQRSWYINGREGSIVTDLISLLEEVFVELSIRVMNNKYGVNGEPADVSVPSGLMRDGSKITKQAIIEIAAQNHLGFDLVNDTLLKDKECYIINSVATDIEILNGMISILSTVLTSNQFLSINRNYDRIVGQRQKMEMLAKTEGAKTQAMVRYGLQELAKPENAEILSMLRDIVSKEPQEQEQE